MRSFMAVKELAVMDLALTQMSCFNFQAARGHKPAFSPRAAPELCLELVPPK
jgi:hypothetical protein